MNKQEQLDWLARNVSEWEHWGDGSPKYVSIGCHGGGFTFADIVLGDYYCRFTMDEWKKRRSELINKPSWNDAPDWANYICQNDIGCWYWCKHAQVINSCNGWAAADPSVDDECLCSSTGEPLDWKNSIEKRPQKEAKMKDEFKPTHTVVESNGAECDVVIKYSSDQMTVVKNESNVETVIYAMSGAIVKEYTSPQDKKCEELFEKWKENQYNAPFQDVYGQSAALSAIKMILDEELLK